MPDYIPPYKLNDTIVNRVAEIAAEVYALKEPMDTEQRLRLRKVNRMRTVQGSLAIEGNTLSVEQITAIMDGKRVLAPVREVQEAHNALAAYEAMDQWLPTNESHFLEAHQMMMIGLQAEAGVYRSGNVGVMSGKSVIHMAPQASRIPELMVQLFKWLSTTDAHPLIASCVFHYEFEFIHPFADGNGRMGRLWQSLILSRWQEVFLHETRPSEFGSGT